MGLEKIFIRTEAENLAIIIEYTDIFCYNNFAISVS